MEELHNIHLFIGAERHDPSFGESVVIAAESVLVFGVVRHDGCVHTRLRGLHRLDGGFAAFSVVDLKVVRVGYLYRKSEPPATRLLDLNGDLVEAGQLVRFFSRKEPAREVCLSSFGAPPWSDGCSLDAVAEGAGRAVLAAPQPETQRRSARAAKSAGRLRTFVTRLVTVGALLIRSRFHPTVGAEF